MYIDIGIVLLICKFISSLPFISCFTLATRSGYTRFFKWIQCSNGLSILQYEVAENMRSFVCSFRSFGKCTKIQRQIAMHTQLMWASKSINENSLYHVERNKSVASVHWMGMVLVWYMITNRMQSE